MSRDTFDACLIGPVARDINAVGGHEQPPQPGGAAWYSSMVYLALGLSVAVVTRVAAADEPALLAGLRSRGVAVFNLGARVSTSFRNAYDAANPDARRQRVDAIAPPIRVRDLPALDARIWQIGPLTGSDVSAGAIARCVATGALVGLDVQGLTRRTARGTVEAAAPARRTGYLRRLGVLKADEEELLTYTGASALAAAVDKLRRAGVREVLVTRASRGSTIYGPAGAIAIDPLVPRRVVDPTGCGDTYLAAYLAARLASTDLLACGLFAAAAATIKMESAGPLDAGRTEILARLQTAAPVSGSA